MIIQLEEARKYLKACYPELELGSMIGHGATASVFELPGLVPPQVVKIMDTDALTPVQEDRIHRKTMYDHFQKEAKSMLQLRSCRQIMSLYDWAEYRDPDDRYKIPQYRSYKAVFLLRLERLLGLREYQRERGLTERDLVVMGMDLCLALQCCADNKILHRDVKPDNIFIRFEGRQKRFVLGDFGFCREFEEVDVRRLSQCGTHAFRAPELVKRTVKQGEYNSDIYSLGTTLYYLASGGRFPHDFAYEDDREALKRISDGFADVILQAVEQDPRRRQRHAMDMYLQLKRLLPDAPTQIVAGNHYMFTKQLMLNGKFDEAIQAAKEGCKQEGNDCKRLWAYCVYNKSRGILAASADPQERAAAEKKIKKAERLLDQLVFGGDVNAQYIRAQICLDRGDREGFLMDVREAAEEGSILAAYRYGRALYYGEAGRRNREAGFALLHRAAEAGYLEAVRVAARIAGEDPVTAGVYANQYRGVSVKLTEREKQEQLVKFL